MYVHDGNRQFTLKAIIFQSVLVDYQLAIGYKQMYCDCSSLLLPFFNEHYLHVLCCEHDKPSIIMHVIVDVGLSHSKTLSCISEQQGYACIAASIVVDKFC